MPSEQPAEPEAQQTAEADLTVGTLRAKWATALDAHEDDLGPELAGTIRDTEADLEKQKTVRHAVTWHNIAQIAKRLAQSWKTWVISTTIIQVVPFVAPFVDFLTAL